MDALGPLGLGVGGSGLGAEHGACKAGSNKIFSSSAATEPEPTKAALL